MKLASNQPYFFPYLGYFGLIKHTDMWVVFDTPQFIKKGWIHRNRILKPVSGWQYFRIPLKKHSHKTLLPGIKVCNEKDWRNIILSKLTVYKKTAPFYKETIDVVEKSLSVYTDSIIELTCNSIKEVCAYLDIEWNHKFYSHLNLKIESVTEHDVWALTLCKFLNVSEFWNLPGGIKIYKREKFLDINSDIKFFNQILTPYNQRRTTFEPGLSVIDVMMFNSKNEIRKQLDNYNFITDTKPPSK